MPAKRNVIASACIACRLFYVVSFPLADINARLSSPEQSSRIATKENLQFSKGNNKEKYKTRQNKAHKACGRNCEILSYISKELQLYTANMSELASKQSRSQDFSLLPPTVVGRKTLVTTCHLWHKLFHRGRVTEYFLSISTEAKDLTSNH